MYQDRKILIGKSGDENVYIYPKMANRHGMIAGATGTGKTVTLKVMAESFSDCGVPVFLADVKGDLAGMCRPGVMNENLQGRIEKLGLSELGFDFHSYPTNFWDIYQEKGMPLRTTVSEMGPLLMGRVLGLNETQSAILTVVFKIADDNGLLLLDTKDLKAMLQFAADNSAELSLQYGNINKTSVATIIRAIVGLEAEGGEQFFAEPALSISDFMCRDCDGKGLIQILDCQKLINNPTMYSTFLLWLMSELFETLPEAGDLEKPKMVFYFDEAHMLFNNAPKSLIEKIEQVVKLIRSKGVGIYFITQNPQDIPGGVLAQLGNKVQHALRAYTPAEMKAVKTAAQSYRVNPEFNTETVLTELGTGEALISVLDEDGVPTIVKKCKILPPQSLMGAIDDGTRDCEVKGNLLYTKYSEYFDRESAYEILLATAAEQAENARIAKEQAEAEKAAEKERIAAEKAAEREQAAAERAAERERIAAERAAEKEKAAAEKAAAKKAEASKTAAKKVGKSIATTTGGTIGRELGNAVGKTMGGTFGKKLGGNVGAALGRGVLGSFFR